MQYTRKLSIENKWAQCIAKEFDSNKFHPESARTNAQHIVTIKLAAEYIGHTLECSDHGFTGLSFI